MKAQKTAMQQLAQDTARNASIAEKALRVVESPHVFLHMIAASELNIGTCPSRPVFQEFWRYYREQGTNWDESTGLDEDHDWSLWILTTLLPKANSP